MRRECVKPGGCKDVRLGGGETGTLSCLGESPAILCRVRCPAILCRVGCSYDCGVFANWAPNTSRYPVSGRLIFTIVVFMRHWPRRRPDTMYWTKPTVMLWHASASATGQDGGTSRSIAATAPRNHTGKRMKSPCRHFDSCLPGPILHRRAYTSAS